MGVALISCQERSPLVRSLRPRARRKYRLNDARIWPATKALPCTQKDPTFGIVEIPRDT